MLQAAVVQGGFCNRVPAVELAVGPVISRLQLFRLQQSWRVDYVPGVIHPPVTRSDPALSLHLSVQACARVWRLYVERRSCDAVLDPPVHGPPKDILVVII